MEFEKICLALKSLDTVWRTRIGPILFGAIIANQVSKEYPEYQMVLTLENIGDQCMELAYLRQYQQVNGFKKIAIITAHPNHAVFEYYRGQYDKLIPMDKRKFDYLLNFFNSDLGTFYSYKNHNIYSMWFASAIRLKYVDNNPYVEYADIIKNMYHIPQNSKPCAIISKGTDAYVQKLINDGTIVPNNTIIFNPYAVSQNGVPMSAFEKLAERLKKRGFHIVTSTIDSQQPVKGTIGLNFPLNESVEVCSACGFVLGIRSGFLDLQAQTDVVIVSLDSDNYNITDMCNLEKMWPNNSNIMSIRFLPDQENLIFDKVEDYFLAKRSKEK